MVVSRLYAAAAKSLQSCPTLCDPRDSSPPGSPIPGILQARTLEWVAISFSNAWKWKVKVKALSHVRLLATPWTAAYQLPKFIKLYTWHRWILLCVNNITLVNKTGHLLHHLCTLSQCFESEFLIVEDSSLYLYALWYIRDFLGCSDG